MDPSITINLIEHNEPSNGYLFPHDDERFPGWTMDNFGPVYVPAKGATVKINAENIALYSRIIDIYEGNDLEIKEGKIFINGQQTDSYTFKMDYYWMMGDNRHNSEDSRVWGFVPHDHIVGKPLFIFVSRKKGGFLGFDWSRTFNSAYQM
jgi:signal peptidase I